MFVHASMTPYFSKGGSVVSHTETVLVQLLWPTFPACQNDYGEHVNSHVIHVTEQSRICCGCRHSCDDFLRLSSSGEMFFDELERTLSVKT